MLKTYFSYFIRPRLTLPVIAFYALFLCAIFFFGRDVGYSVSSLIGSKNSFMSLLALFFVVESVVSLLYAPSNAWYQINYHGGSRSRDSLLLLLLPYVASTFPLFLAFCAAGLGFCVRVSIDPVILACAFLFGFLAYIAIPFAMECFRVFRKNFLRYAYVAGLSALFLAVWLLLDKSLGVIIVWFFSLLVVDACLFALMRRKVATLRYSDFRGSVRSSDTIFLRSVYRMPVLFRGCISFLRSDAWAIVYLICFAISAGYGCLYFIGGTFQDLRAGGCVLFSCSLFFLGCLLERYEDAIQYRFFHAVPASPAWFLLKVLEPVAVVSALFMIPLLIACALRVRLFVIFFLFLYVLFSLTVFLILIRFRGMNLLKSLLWVVYLILMIGLSMWSTAVSASMAVCVFGALYAMFSRDYARMIREASVHDYLR